MDTLAIYEGYKGILQWVWRFDYKVLDYKGCCLILLKCNCFFHFSWGPIKTKHNSKNVLFFILSNDKYSLEIYFVALWLKLWSGNPKVLGLNVEYCNPRTGGMHKYDTLISETQ